MGLISDSGWNSATIAPMNPQLAQMMKAISGVLIPYFLPFALSISRIIRSQVAAYSWAFLFRHLEHSQSGAFPDSLSMLLTAAHSPQLTTGLLAAHCKFSSPRITSQSPLVSVRLSGVARLVGWLLKRYALQFGLAFPVHPFTHPELYGLDVFAIQRCANRALPTWRVAIVYPLARDAFR